MNILYVRSSLVKTLAIALLLLANSAFAQSNKWKKQYMQSLQDSAQIYHAQGLYIKELEKLEDMMILIKTSYGDDRNGENYHDITLRSLIGAYERTGNLHKAVSLYDYALQLAKDNLGEKHADYAALLSGKALVLDQLARYDEAIYHLNQAKDIKAELFGEESIEYAESVSNLSGIYTHLGQYKLAEEMAQQSLSLAELATGGEDPNVAYFIDNLGRFYESTGDFKKAMTHYQMADSLRKKLLGTNDPQYGFTVNNYGNYYFNTGEFEKAKVQLQQASDIVTAENGPQHPSSIAMDWDLARLYEYMGQHDKAERMYNDVVKRYKKSIGPTNPQLIEIQYEMATLYFYTGHHQEAQRMLEHALMGAEEVYGRRHPVYADGLIVLAEKHFFTHEYTTAEAQYKEALRIRRDILETAHPLVAAAHNNLGVLYDYMSLYRNALEEYKTALEIRKEVFGELHPDVAATMNNLGGLYLELDMADSAEPYFNKAMEINREVLGEDHSFFGFSITNMAMYYKRSKQYEKALELYEKAMKVNKEMLGKDHSMYIYSVRDVAHVKTSMADYAGAEPFWDITLGYYLDEVNRHFPHLSATDKARFHKNMYTEYEMFFNYALLHYRSDEIIKNAFSRQSQSKGLVHLHRQHIEEVLGRSSDPGLTSKLQQWKSQKEKLEAMKNAKAKGQDLGSIEEIDMQVSNLEIELALAADSMSNSGHQLEPMDWKTVQAELGPGEVAVQIIRFKRYRFVAQGYFIDSSYHAALIISPETQDIPQLLLMGEKVSVEQKLVANVTRGRHRKDDYAELHRKFWQPLEEVLPSGTKRIFLSSDGVYDFINFDKLKAEKGNSAARKFDIVKLNNIRQLTNLEASGFNLMRE